MMQPPPLRPQTDGIEKPKKLSEYPGYIIKKARGFFKRLFYIVSLVWQAAPATLIALGILCLLDGAVPVVGAYISKYLLDAVANLIGAQMPESVFDAIFVTMRPALLLLVIYFIYMFVKRILLRLNTMVTGIAGELVSNHIREGIITKAGKVDIASFDRPEFYEKLENATREAGMRPIHILSATFNLISAMISTVSFIVILTALSPITPILIIGASVPGAVVNYIYRNRNFRYIRRHSRERREMNYYTSALTNKELVKEIRILGLGDTFVAKYRSSFGKYYSGLRRLIVREGIDQIAVGLVSTIVNCLLFAYVAYNVIFSNGQIGDYSLYTGALTSITGYVTLLMNSTSTIYEGTLFINNLMEFMNEKPTVVPTLPEPRIPERGKSHTIEFKNVSFRYPGTERNVIENLNLTLTTPETVVLVGLNGAGKTTLIKLLTRLYDPTEGVILLDGRDIKEYNTAAFYDLFGIIFQDFGKYAETVAENISFGDINGDHTLDDAVIAARHADADNFIRALPLGYETPLTRMFDETGIELSGGQWQKLSVARAFYKNSDILILDEPTASLDAMAEKAVFDRFSELSGDKLAVFVSHRLSSATSADKIVVLDEGRLAEIGTHRELMEKGGVYAKLFITQADRYQFEK